MQLPEELRSKVMLFHSTPTADIMKKHIRDLDLRMEDEQKHSWAKTRWYRLANLIQCYFERDMEYEEAMELLLLSLNIQRVGDHVVEKGRPSLIYSGMRPSWDK